MDIPSQPQGDQILPTGQFNQSPNQDTDFNQPLADQGGSMNQFSQSPIQDGSPYFMGDYALVRFSSGEDGYGPDTYWLVDKSNNTIRPFESNMALDAAFGEDLQSALQNAMTITPPRVDQNGDVTDGILSGFSILGPEYAIKDDGTSKSLDFSPSQLRGRYGKPINENGEKLSVEALDGFLNLMKKNESKTGIPASFISKIKNDSKLMAFYVSSLAYGDYTLNDLYDDIGNRFNDFKE